MVMVVLIMASQLSMRQELVGRGPCTHAHKRDQFARTATLHDFEHRQLNTSLLNSLPRRSDAQSPIPT